MKQINIGFIGAGDISILHAQSIHECPEAQLVGLWNITPELAQEKSKRYDCKIYESAEALVADPNIDAVFVLTNLETHHYYTLMALQAGKHVYVEKPVGATISELKEMQRTADANNLICMPGHNYIYEPGLFRSKKMLESGRLGKLSALYIMYNIHHPEEVASRYPGVIRHIMTHHAYIHLYLAGMPQALTAMKSVIDYQDFQEENLAMVTLQHKGGALCHYTASFATDDHSSDPWTMMVKIIGTEGATRYSYRDWVENKPGEVHSHTFSAYQETITQAGQYFMEECIAKGRQPLSSMQDAIDAQKIIEGIEMAIREGKTTVIN